MSKALFIIVFIMGHLVVGLATICVKLVIFLVACAFGHIVVVGWFVLVTFVTLIVYVIAETVREQEWLRRMTCVIGTPIAKYVVRIRNGGAMQSFELGNMTVAPSRPSQSPTSPDLLTDDLGALLTAFPEADLRIIVDILKSHTTWSPLPARRAAAAHAAGAEENLAPHATAIAGEILWWGSHDIARQFGSEPKWPAIVADVARSMGVAQAECGDGLPAWRVEGAMIRKMLADWEKLDPAQRKAILSKLGGDYDAAGGGLAAAAGMGAGMFGAELLALLGAEGAGAAFGAALLGPVVAALGAGWIVHKLAGPAYRVLRPVTIKVAITRQSLRDARNAESFVA